MICDTVLVRNILGCSKMSLYVIILTVFLTCHFTSSAAISDKPPAKRSIINAYPDTSRYGEVFRPQDSSENLLKNFLADEKNKHFIITQNGDHVSQIPLMEHDSSEDYYDYDESEHVLADENSSNEIDSGTKKKYLQKRKTDEAVEVPDYIVNFFIEQKILREQREKERRCKEEQTYYTRTPPPNSDINLVLHTRTKYPSKIDYNIFDLKTNELPDTSNDELHEESEDYDGESDYEEEGSEGDFVPESQDHITSTAATTITTAQPEEPRPRWNSIKNVLSNVSNYKRPQKVDRYISKQPGEKHRSRRSTSKKEKTHRKPFRDILYKIIPKQYAKRYIAPKYFPKTDRVTSKVYPVLTKEILRNELHDPAKAKTAHLPEDSSTMSQVGLEDLFNHDIRRNRRNERPIDVVGSFEQVW